MSLRLRQAIAGRPSVQSNQSLDVLTYQDERYIIYTSASNVVILDPELELTDTLEFWSALPPRVAGSSSQGVQGVRCTQEGLVIAWSGVHVVIWQRSIKGRHKWVVHSTLVATSQVTCLDFQTGTLVLGTQRGLECWKTENTDEIVIWDRLWDRNVPSPSYVTLSINTGHIAWYKEGERSVHILGVTSKGQADGIPQDLRHPRSISHIGWRKSSENSGDAYLYTTTSDSVLRIYSPVLDDPAWFQLLSTLDPRSFTQTKSTASAKGKEHAGAAGIILTLDANVVRLAAREGLQRAKEEKAAPEVLGMLESLDGEECDVVMWCGADGQIALRSIINMDRKPPTLLKSLPLSRLVLQTSTLIALSPQTCLLQPVGTPHFLAIPPPASGRDITSTRISLVDLLAGRQTGLSPISTLHQRPSMQLSEDLSHFVRTPNGRGLLAICKGGETAMWYADHLGKPPKGSDKKPALVGRGIWSTNEPPLLSAIFAKGRAIVSYTRQNGKPEVVLQHLEEGSTKPSDHIVLPDLEVRVDDEIEMLLAVSDIDDGYSSRGRRTQRAYVMAASRKGHAWVWRLDSRFSNSVPASPTATIRNLLESPMATLHSSPPEITLLSHYVLPFEGDIAFIRPVDPMGWHQSTVDWKADVPLQDMILTVSKDGVLEFWSPELGHHFDRESTHHVGVGSNGDEAVNGRQIEHEHLPWSRTGVVRTGISDATMARCSSRKKTVLIRESGDVHEMTIWDSKTSEFSTGLELTHTFLPGETVQDLDWTTTSDLQSVLAVGFAHKVVLVCEQRLSYVKASPAWAPFLEVDLTAYTSMPICDSIWLSGGSLAIGAGNQVYLFSRFLDRDSPTSTPAASIRKNTADGSGRATPVGIKKEIEDSDEPEDLFQLIALENGPLWDYHPTVLSQCLLWNKIDLVKSIINTLVDDLKQAEILNSKSLRYKRLDPSAFFQEERPVKLLPKRNGYEGLFDAAPTTLVDDDEERTDDFHHKTVKSLKEYLDGPIRVPLKPNEKVLLGTVAESILEVERQRRSLDVCGQRYLLAIRMFVKQKVSAANDSSIKIQSRVNGYDKPFTGEKSENFLSFRNVVWAMHSESQDVLLAAATETCENSKMLWSDANLFGVFCWLTSTEVVRAQLEVVARNRYMSDEDRDPTSCSLIFFALGKKKVVHGLWRQALGHREQQAMLKFLANDFETERWKTAAVKNAYALLSKQRYEYAAAFFMLAGSPKDAINVIIRHLNDWQLAFALARAVENTTDGPLVKNVLNDVVLPRAFQGGHRWLATWGFWMLGRRDLAVRVLISPMTEVASAWSFDLELVGDPANDDPSLLLLFRHLKSKSLQTAKGTSEIPERTEFDFVLHNARVFFKLGCHGLGLDLLRSWSFERPFFPAPKSRIFPLSGSGTPMSSAMNGAPTPTALGNTPRRPSDSRIRPSPRRASFILGGHGHGHSHRRTESMVMDMDMDALAEGDSRPESRVTSPPPLPNPDGEVTNGVSNGGPAMSADALSDEGKTIKNDDHEQAAEPPKKIGNLMKELKQDVQQGAMEFNMDNFF